MSLYSFLEAKPKSKKPYIDYFKKSKQAGLYDNHHVLDIDGLYPDDLVALKKNKSKTPACVLLLTTEPHDFLPGSMISRQWIEFKDELLRYQIFNCDFFVTCMFANCCHDHGIEYLNKNHYGWTFHRFSVDHPTEASKNKTELENNGTELFLDKCKMKFSHLNFTHRMHRQLFSKFLIRENLVKGNLVAINPPRETYAGDVRAKGRKKLIDAGYTDGWFYNKNLLSLWNDVPMEYHQHPDIHNTFNVVNQSFLNQASFNIVSESLFNYPAAHYTEKTTQSFMSKRPFIMIGPCGNLRDLRAMGFRTFHRIIDESYDEIEDPNERLEAIMQLILNLEKQSQQELNNMVYEVRDELIHNYSLMEKKIKDFTGITK